MARAVEPPVGELVPVTPDQPFAAVVAIRALPFLVEGVAGVGIADALVQRDAPCTAEEVGRTLLLWNAGRRGGRVRTLQLATSADAGAPPERVVGYGAFADAEAAA